MLTPGDHVRRIAPLRDRPEYNHALEQRNRLENTLVPWLSSRRGVPFVALVHTYLVHDYQPEPELAARFTKSLPPTPLRLTGPIPHRELLSEKKLKELGHGDDRFEFVGAGDHEFTPARDLPWIEATYDATVAQADRDVGRVLAMLDQLGLSKSTIVVVSADHGEEMLEHGDLGHARSLFDEILRVPLIVRVPGVEPRVVDEPVESIDVAPTLLARLGLPVDPRMDGADLLAPKWEPRAISIHEGVEFSDPKLAGRTLRCARARSAKLVVVAEHKIERPLDPTQSALGQLQAQGYFQHTVDLGGDRSPVTGLFDLAADPREQVDLSDATARTPTLESKAQALFAALARATESGR
jgi:hypothetical protein